MNQKKILIAFSVSSLALVLSACGGSTPVKKTEEAAVKSEVVVEKQEVKKVEPVQKVTPVEPASVAPVKKEVEAKPVEAEPIKVEEKPRVEKAVAPASKPATSSPSKAAVSAADQQLASEKELKQKIMYSKMMFMSKASKRIAASSNDEAKAILAESKDKMQQAKTALDAGDRRTAQDLINESMRMFNSASIMVPSEAVIAEQKKRYQDLLKELEANRQTHKENYDKMVKKQGKEAGVEYDVEQVEVLVVEAKKLADSGDYESAGATVDSASRMVTDAISEMLHDQTITYELNIDTPEGEWKYELDRYLGYEELIPVAIETKKPSKGQLFLINRSVDKGKEMAETARKTAAAGDYPRAIAMINDATKEIRKALKIMGVKQ